MAIVGVAILTVGAFGASPAAADGEVVLETMANGEPADSAPGPTVASGSTVTIRYVITVASTEPLYDFIVVNETNGSTPNCDANGDGQLDDTNGHPGPLSNGDSFFCVATVVAGDSGVTYSTIGRVKAFDFDLIDSFVHQDAAHYTTAKPPTTQAPTTQAPTTQAPTTAAPTTAAPTTKPPTTRAPTTAAPTTRARSTAESQSSTESPPSSTVSSAATSVDSTRSASSDLTLSRATTGDTLALPSTDDLGRDTDDSGADDSGADDEVGDEDDDPVGELAFDDTDPSSGGTSWWWVVLAFAAGAVVTGAVLVGPAAKSTPVPDQ